MRSTSSTRNRICAAGLIASSFILAFWRLDSVPLCRDEADTALLAADIAQHGLRIPRYFDGRQLVVHLPNGFDTDERFVPVIPGWLQYYVEAAAFKLLGVGTWSARFPFALLGLAAVFVLYQTGAILFTGMRVYLPPLLAVGSIFSLTAFRQARYYALVYLFAALLLFEMCRYIRNRRLATQASFYMRLGLWGMLLYLSHWGSFAATWFALSVFVLLTKDRILLRGWVALGAILAIPAGAEFFLVHLNFLLNSRARVPVDWAAVRQIARINIEALWSMLPLVFLLPVALWIRKRWKKFDPALYWAALLALCVIFLPVVFTIAVARLAAEPRYYTQILPAIALSGSLAIVFVAQAGKRLPALLLGVAILIWPNLGFNIDWADEIVERQLFAKRNDVEPVLEYLQGHMRPGDTYAVFSNQQGQVFRFYLPEHRWVALLESANPYSRRFRNLVPADAFDDYQGANWYVIWHPRWFELKSLPPQLSGQYHRVWQYRVVHPLSLWDKVRLWLRPSHPSQQVEEYELWRQNSHTPS